MSLLIFCNAQMEPGQFLNIFLLVDTHAEPFWTISHISLRTIPLEK